MLDGLKEHLLSLPALPVLDVLGKWIHLPNARTGTTSIDEGPLRGRCVMHQRDKRLWATVWEEIIVPNEDVAIFTFVRNPWDRICSAFFQCRDRARTPENKIDQSWEFADWVKKILAVRGPECNMHFAEQYPTAYFNGAQYCYVGRFENLEQDWRIASMIINVPGHLPHRNAAVYGSYMDHYDEESIEIVEKLYKRDIEAFGYEFGEE